MIPDPSPTTAFPRIFSASWTIDSRHGNARKNYVPMLLTIQQLLLKSTRPSKIASSHHAFIFPTLRITIHPPWSRERRIE
ncbi:uncharacterized protein AFUA_4G13640 [Aspergillus fumigatus Af293]|uniref:Uncharacterized protein n=2 Tax=Aspergillus fumigatus TaxID=746128 RepID=Q4WQQ5_ASPFU|nr:hypothetical protein AFUA_4G13640 [Aspergillus fumigatus Af293]EAL89429.1 hypothetical protein AFUA_4G13640 [Aspergillus fumigatus Af293]EDP50716.1 hypothetical protein AFUB_070560 [Aspergillus fumigatus A1163]